MKSQQIVIQAQTTVVVGTLEDGTVVGRQQFTVEMTGAWRKCGPLTEMIKEGLAQLRTAADENGQKPEPEKRAKTRRAPKKLVKGRSTSEAETARPN